MAKVIANVNKRLSTGVLVEGQPFECSRADAEVLKKIGWARDENESHAVGAISTQTYQTRALQAEPAKAPNDSTKDQPAKSEVAAEEDLSKLTKAELVKRAAAAGVDVASNDTKAKLVSKLRRYNRRDMRAEG